jgi:hypothetical protein
MLAAEPDVSVGAEPASNDFIFIDMAVPNIAGLI